MFCFVLSHERFWRYFLIWCPVSVIFVTIPQRHWTSVTSWEFHVNSPGLVNFMNWRPHNMLNLGTVLCHENFLWNASHKQQPFASDPISPLRKKFTHQKFHTNTELHLCKNTKTNNHYFPILLHYNQPL